MGMVLLPVFMGALFIVIRALIKIIPLIRGNELTASIIAVGLAIPAVLVICISFYWVQKGKLPHMIPLFNLPFLLIYLPALIYLVLKLILPAEIISLIRSTVLVSLVTSGVLIIPLISYLPGLLKKMGVRFYY